MQTDGGGRGLSTRLHILQLELKKNNLEPGVDEKEDKHCIAKVNCHQNLKQINIINLTKSFQHYLGFRPLRNKNKYILKRGTSFNISHYCYCPAADLFSLSFSQYTNYKQNHWLPLNSLSNSNLLVIQMANIALNAI